MGSKNWTLGYFDYFLVEVHWNRARNTSKNGKKYIFENEEFSWKVDFPFLLNFLHFLMTFVLFNLKLIKKSNKKAKNYSTKKLFGSLWSFSFNRVRKSNPYFEFSSESILLYYSFSLWLHCFNLSHVLEYLRIVDSITNQ